MLTRLDQIFHLHNGADNYVASLPCALILIPSTRPTNRSNLSNLTPSCSYLHPFAVFARRLFLQKEIHDAAKCKLRAAPDTRLAHLQRHAVKLWIFGTASQLFTAK